MTWEYPQRLDKHCTNKILFTEQSQRRFNIKKRGRFCNVSGMYWLQYTRSKRMFRNYLKEMKI